MRTVSIISKTTILLALFVFATQAAEWTAPVQVSTRSDVYEVRLAKEPATDNLFAALAWTGDGWSTHFSNNGGTTWTETYHGGPGTVVNDIALAQNGDYFYVAIALPTVCALFRFNTSNGAQEPWGGADWILIAAEPFEEIALTSPENVPSAGMHFVAHSFPELSGRLYYADSYYGMSDWTDGGWQGVYDVDRGLSAVSVYNDQVGVSLTEVYISFITPYNSFAVYNNTRPVGGWDEISYGSAGLLARFTDLSAAGIPGFGGRLYHVYELGTSSLISVVGWIDGPDAGWTFDLLETSGNIFSPAISACFEGGVGLAYTKSWGSSIVIVQGKYEQDPWNNFYSPTDGPNETYSSSIPAFEVQPDIVQTCGSGHGIIFVRNTSPRYAYYTRRTIYCGEYTSGYAGNTDCSTDGKRNLADITRLIDRVYISKQSLCIDNEGNVDGDDLGKLNLADITRLIDHVYISKLQTAICR